MAASSTRNDHIAENEASHLHHLGAGLYQLQKEDVFCDVTITIDNRHFRAHKSVLTAGSDYFRAMFRGGFQEQRSTDVNIPGDANIFECLLEYIYTGKLQIGTRKVIDILDLANYLQIPHAIAKCATLLIQRLKESNRNCLIPFEEVARIWSLSNEICHSTLTTTTDVYVTFYFFMYSKMTEFFEHMPSDFLSNLLDKLEDLAVAASEEKLFISTIKWLKYDWPHRKSLAYKLLQKIRLGIVPIISLTTWLDDEIQEIPECKMIMEFVLGLHSSKEISKVPLAYSHPSLFSPRSTVRALIAVGGDTDKEDFVQYFDNKSGLWKDLPKFCILPEMNVTLCLPGLVSVHGNLYLAGGKICTDTDTMYTSNKFFVFQVMDNRWNELRSMNVKRDYCSLVHLGNYIYAIGGTEKRPDEFFSTPIRSAERYDMEVGKWEMLPDMPEECFTPSVVTFDGKILVYGPLRMEPHNGEPSLYTLMMFNPESNSWTPLWSCQTMSGFIPSLLTVHENSCYEVRYEDDGPRGNHKPKVRQLKLSFEKETASVDFGEHHSQDLTMHYHQFCINNHLFVVVSLFDYIHDTGITLSVDNANSPVHKNWSRAKDIGGFDKSVVSFSFDKLALE